MELIRIKAVSGWIVEVTHLSRTHLGPRRTRRDTQAKLVVEKTKKNDQFRNDFKQSRLDGNG
jgi:hypothetical protein